MQIDIDIGGWAAALDDDAREFPDPPQLRQQLWLRRLYCTSVAYSISVNSTLPLPDGQPLSSRAWIGRLVGDKDVYRPRERFKFEGLVDRQVIYENMVYVTVVCR